MVQAATPADAQRGEQLLNKGGSWNRHADAACGILDQVQIFKMQINLESRSKIAGQDFFRLLIKAFAARESSAERTNHFLRIHSRFCTEYQRFTNRREVDGYNDLIREFRKSTGAERPHMRDRFTESVENLQGSLEILRLAAGHDRECCVDRTLLA